MQVLELVSRYYRSFHNTAASIFTAQTPAAGLLLSIKTRIASAFNFNTMLAWMGGRRRVLKERKARRRLASAFAQAALDHPRKPRAAPPLHNTTTAAGGQGGPAYPVKIRQLLTPGKRGLSTDMEIDSDIEHGVPGSGGKSGPRVLSTTSNNKRQSISLDVLAMTLPDASYHHHPPPLLEAPTATAAVCGGGQQSIAAAAVYASPQQNTDDHRQQQVQPADPVPVPVPVSPALAGVIYEMRARRSSSNPLLGNFKKTGKAKEKEKDTIKKKGTDQQQQQRGGNYTNTAAASSRWNKVLSLLTTKTKNIRKENTSTNANRQQHRKNGVVAVQVEEEGGSFWDQLGQ